MIYPKGLDENIPSVPVRVRVSKLLRGFWARGRVRGGPVCVCHVAPSCALITLTLVLSLVRAFAFSAEAIFLVCPPATPLHLHVFGFGTCQDFG